MSGDATARTVGAYARNEKVGGHSADICLTAKAPAHNVRSLPGGTSIRRVEDAEAR